MPSRALTAFDQALSEVHDLVRASPALFKKDPRHIEIARAVGRAGIVLLSAHFERYIYVSNEQVVEFLNAQKVLSHQVPKNLRLIHSRISIDELAGTSWERRAAKLAQYSQSEAWLWQDGSVGQLLPDRLLMWMKAPNVESLIRYYKFWDIEDIFSAITRGASTRTALFLSIKSLVDKRNAIAHGDISEQASPKDVLTYAKAARDFCARADRCLAKQAVKIFKSPSPW